MIPDASTRLYAVVGHPIGHSLSPVMHNAAFRAAGVNAVYLAFDSRDIAGCLRAMGPLGVSGMSVTMPHKQAVLPLLDEIEPMARRSGAVNTVVNREGRLWGYNTDGPGALRALEERVPCAGKRVLLVGAGGAARAIGVALQERGADLVVTNRSRGKGESLARMLGGAFCPPEDLHGEGWEVLVQTTPVGMAPGGDRSLVPEDLLAPGMTVMDIVYNPRETRLLREAAARGCQVVSGVRMFVHQGAEQFRLWTGRTPPLEVMAGAVEKALEGDGTS